MRVFLLAAVLALASPQSPAQNAQNNVVIEGRILRGGSMDPIPNVQVTLSKTSGSGALNGEAAAALVSLQDIINNNPGLSQALLDSLTTSREQALGLAPGTLGVGSSVTAVLTDSTGHFSFKDQVPGKYTIRATREGFFGPPMNGAAVTAVTKTITIEAQKPVPSADLFMVQGGIISGRIRDPNGLPASGVTVGANRVTYSNGRPQWTTVTSKATDDRGEYRIFWLGPGEYYVGTTQRNVVSTLPNPQDSWARTFYPGVADAATASLLTIKDGVELSGIDFSIQSLAAAATFKITGKATNPFAAPNAQTGVVDRSLSSIILSPREPGILDSNNPSTVQNSIPANARPNGEFELRNIKPGSYELIAYSMSAAPTAVQVANGVAPPLVPPLPPIQRRYYIDRKAVEVRNSDVDGVVLEISKGTEMRGYVKHQEVGTFPLDKIKINLHSNDTVPEAFASISGSIAVDAGGGFSATELPAARFTLQISGLPDNAYVADIRQNGISVFDTGVTLGSQPVTAVEILVNGNGETIEGTVHNAERKPAANASVVHVPPASRRPNAMLYKSVQSDGAGHFIMKGVAPGEYTLYAWESIAPTAWMNSDFLMKYQNRGTSVVASGGSRADIPLELIPDDFSRR